MKKGQVPRPSSSAGALTAGQAEKGIANGDDMVQNTSESMELEEKDTRRPEGGNQMWSDSTSGPKKSSAGIWVALVILLLLAGLGAGGYYFYLTQNSQTANQLEEGASQVTQVPVEPIATPTPEVNRAEWTIDVQNGTETAGIARKVADELEALGYKIGKVGNAPSNVSISELHVTSSDETRASTLLGDFKAYGVSQIEGDIKKATLGSAQLVIGANYGGASSEATSVPEE